MQRLRTPAKGKDGNHASAARPLPQLPLRLRSTSRRLQASRSAENAAVPPPDRNPGGASTPVTDLLNEAEAAPPSARPVVTRRLWAFQAATDLPTDGTNTDPHPTRQSLPSQRGSPTDRSTLANILLPCFSHVRAHPPRRPRRGGFPHRATQLRDQPRTLTTNRRQPSAGCRIAGTPRR